MKATDPIVYVIDDDSLIRRGLESLIKSVSLRVETFATAHEFMQSKRPDVASCLVLDVRLPDQSGLDLQRGLVAAGINIPIIFITGHGDIPMTVRAMREGAREFLTKPVVDRICSTPFKRLLPMTDNRAQRQPNSKKCMVDLPLSLPAR